MPAVICHDDRQAISGRGPIARIPGSRIAGYDRSSGDDRWYRARVALATHAGGPCVVWDLSQWPQNTTMGLEGQSCLYRSIVDTGSIRYGSRSCLVCIRASVLVLTCTHFAWALAFFSVRTRGRNNVAQSTGPGHFHSYCLESPRGERSPLPKPVLSSFQKSVVAIFGMSTYYGGKGPMCNGVLWMEVVIFAVFVGLRLYTRQHILKAVGVDDYLCCFALVRATRARSHCPCEN